MTGTVPSGMEVSSLSFANQTAADPDQLAVTYWNGTDWQLEVCEIPQAGQPHTSSRVPG